MDRKHTLLVIGLLVLLVPACLCPGTSGISPSLFATGTALVPILLTSAAASETAAVAGHTGGSGAPTATPPAIDTPTAMPTNTPPPATATITPSPTPAEPTATATQGPPLKPITDACPLLDVKQVEGMVGQKMVNTQKFSQPGSFVRCYTGTVDASTGATLSVAQDNVALTLLLADYAAFEKAPSCDWSKLTPGDDVAVKEALVELAKLGVPPSQYLIEGLRWTYQLAETKSCIDQNGLQQVSGLGDISLAEHIFGYEELGMVYRNTLVYISVYKPGLPGPQALVFEQTLMTAIFNNFQKQ